jgi:hypothetical protein
LGGSSLELNGTISVRALDGWQDQVVDLVGGQEVETVIDVLDGCKLYFCLWILKKKCESLNQIVISNFLSE